MKEKIEKEISKIKAEIEMKKDWSKRNFVVTYYLSDLLEQGKIEHGDIEAVSKVLKINALINYNEEIEELEARVKMLEHMLQNSVAA